MTTTVNSMRALAVGLALVVSMGALAGCGSDEPVTTTRTVTTDTTAPVMPPAATTTTTERTTTTEP